MAADITWSWKARTAGGDVQSGTMTAPSASEVSRRLRGDGRFVLSVEEGLAGSGAPEIDVDAVRRRELVRRVGREEAIAFCQQLSIMLQTGVPMDEALKSMKQGAGRREFGIVLDGIRNEVCSGGRLSDAVARWPRVFPKIVVSLLRASEVSGTTPEMLDRAGKYLAGERRVLRQVRGALAYPAIMMITAIGLSCFLVLFVLPRFATVFAGREASLPLATKMLLGLSETALGHWQIILPSLVAVVTGAMFAARLPSVRTFLDHVKLGVPVIGPIIRSLHLARAARTMSTLLRGGVHVLDIIRIGREVTTNVVWERLWDRIDQGVRDGQLISHGIAGSNLVPSTVSSMIASGERSGKLPDVMERIAEFAEEDLEQRIKTATSFIEPVMVIAMGLIVGGVAIALLLPIFKMSQVVGG